MHYRPNEEEVQLVMKETGMGEIQAYRHVGQREEIRHQMRMGIRGPVFRAVTEKESVTVVDTGTEP